MREKQIGRPQGSAETACSMALASLFARAILLASWCKIPQRTHDSVIIIIVVIVVIVIVIVVTVIALVVIVTGVIVIIVIVIIAIIIVIVSVSVSGIACVTVFE